MLIENNKPDYQQRSMASIKKVRMDKINKKLTTLKKCLSPAMKRGTMPKSGFFNHALIFFLIFSRLLFSFQQT
jgi:hypothetical protein